MKLNYFIPVLLFAIGCNNSPKGLSHQDSLVADSTAVVDSIYKAESKKDPRTIGPAGKASEQVAIEQAIEKMKTPSDSSVGFWVGQFGHNKINIAIAEVKDGNATGYSVCAGNFRPITGTVKKSGAGKFSFVMNEPGTDKYDGHFEFVIDMANKTMTGTWTPFKETTEKKEFTLQKTVFVYNPALGQYPEASQRLLTKDDVENKMKEDLTVMRTEIYARHGYSFKNPAIRASFDTTSWFIPMGTDIRTQLTDVEVKNINLIYTYETYYAESYDDYGR